MNDLELDAMWNFLDKLNVAEITEGNANAASFIESAFECSAAAFKVDDATSSESSIASDKTSERSTSDDDTKSTSTPPKKFSKAEMKRKLQRGYDNKYRVKAKLRKEGAAKAFLAGLKLLNVLLEDQIQRTRKVFSTRRLLSLGKDAQKFPDYDRELQIVDQEAKTQLGLNQAASNYIELWTSTWTLSKIENGKFFLKPYAPKIEEYIKGLVKLGVKLTETTTELEWCMDQKPSGVWI